jgi:hypothetical protein
MDPLSLIVLLGVWVIAACGCGFLLAILARRVHTGLSLIKLWVFYTSLMAFLVAIVFLLAWF